MNKNTLLLDLDGVVNINKKIDKKVFDLSVKYLQKELKVNIEKAKKINSKYYPKLGHTYKIIKYFDKDVREESYYLDKYNNFVFNSIDYNYLYKSLTTEDYIHFEKFNNFLESLSLFVNYYIYTNAPYIWCYEILKMTGLNDKFEKDKLITSDVIKYTKPEIESYSSIDSKFNNDKLFFVDDSYKNLIYPSKVLDWKCIHFAPM